MNGSNHQKAKLLILWDMLKGETDEDNPLTTRQLIARLEAVGISCDRRTLYRDIADLNNLGYEVMSVMKSHEKAYYVADRTFSVPELRILMDAVQAANFIAPEKSEQLADKIAALGGRCRAELLRNNTVLFNIRKHHNDTTLYTIDTVEQAISQGMRVSFCYFDLNENRERCYRRGGRRYHVEPAGLVFMGDRYYLTGTSRDRKGLSIYRVDRMDQIRTEEGPETSELSENREHMKELAAQAFQMFAGKTEWVTLEFEDGLIGAVFDHFGEEIHICRTGEHLCCLKAEVQISPTFFGWLFQFGPGIRLTGPERVRRQICKFIAQLPYGD